ncbi:50S ribosomal protein L3 [Candidatus Microgenomates bacterium]|nr:50S ribosomal protein L3 [Candidatus Microgenomates bacterium]
MKAVIGRKIGMSQVLAEDGTATAVTLLLVEPTVVTQLRTAEQDGYLAVQIGGGVRKHITKPLAGHLKASGSQAKLIREVRLPVALSDASPLPKVGDKLDIAMFTVGDAVTLTGLSKGKGFAGTVKRHNFKRGPKSHGSKSYRALGSIGSMFPQKVFKGKKMAGRLGHEQVTLRQVPILQVDVDDQIIAVKGPVPGPNKGLVLVRG